MERQVRMLFPWLEDIEAIANLLGHMPAPGENISGQQARLNASRVFLQQRPAYALPTPIIRDLPAEIQEQGAAFCKRPEVVSAFQGLDWSLGMADLRQVLSFQKMVVEEQATERANSINIDDFREVFTFCLPESGSEIALSGTIDQDQRALTVSSLDPNLRVGTHVTFDMEATAVPGTSGRKEKVIGFTINFGVKFVQIAEFQGRWFVRDGYHRTYGLLTRGVHDIPCVFIRARTFQELGAAQPGFLPYQTLFSERPPFVTDFLDDNVSASVKQKAIRKVIRISAEEFVVEL